MTLRSILLVAGLAALATAWSLPSAAARQESARLELADAYLQAYAHLDLDRLRTFWDETTTWCDPTTAEIGGPSAPVLGPEAIVQHLTGAVQGTQDLAFTFEERFHSGGLVVALGTLRYVLPAAALGRADGDARFEMRVVIVLRIANGKVVQHTDYTDFSHWLETIEASKR